jgi:hypothetical protein
MNLLAALYYTLPFQRPRHGDNWFDGLRYNAGGGIVLAPCQGNDREYENLSIASLLAEDWQVRTKGGQFISVSDDDLEGRLRATAEQLGRLIHDEAAEEPELVINYSRIPAARAPKRKPATRKQRKSRRK